MARPNFKPLPAPTVAGGGAVAFNVGLEIMAPFGAEKTNPAPPPNFIQATANNDILQHVDTLDDAYRFAKVGNPLYRVPVGGGAGAAPDRNLEAFRNAVNQQITFNLDACENLSRAAFTLIMRYWQESSGFAQRDIHVMWGGSGQGPEIEYVSGGTDQLLFSYPGDPPLTLLTLDNVPEDQMITLVSRFDGATVYASAYGEDGSTVLDAKSAAVVSLASVSNRMQFGAGQVQVRRLAYLNEFVADGARFDALRAQILTDAPLLAA